MLSRHEARQHSAFVSRRNFEQEGNIISEPLFGVIAEVINPWRRAPGITRIRRAEGARICNNLFGVASPKGYRSLTLLNRK